MEDRHLSVTITTSTVLKTLSLLVLAWLIFYLRDIVLDVLTAIVIASAIEPGVAGLRRKKVPRVLGVLAIYVAIFCVFFVLFYFFLPSLMGDFASFISGIPSYIGSITQSGVFTTYANLLGVPPQSLLPVDSIMSSIRDALNIPAVFSSSFAAASAIFGGVFSCILIVVFSFYFAVIETGVDDFLRVAVPKSHQAYVISLWKRSQHKIGLWMQGQLLLAVIMGVLVYLGLTILGVQHSLLLAVLAACFEIIPVFGPTLSAIPAVAIAFVTSGATLGLLTVALYVIAQQFENHLIYPLVVTRVVGVPPLLVILALIAGWELAGFLGIILSVPLAALIQELARDIERGKFGKNPA